MTHPRAALRTQAIDPASYMRWFGALGLSMFVLLAGAHLARAQETIIKSHGFAEFGELKYPKDFKNFDYVNPDAPRGGELAYAAQGTFDGFNPYTRKGRAGARSASQYESLLTPSYDEAGSFYGLVAESLEYPESQDWVIFNLRPEARFSDGSAITADDVVFSHNLLLDQGLKSYAEAVRKRIPKAEALSPLRVKFTFAADISRRSLISQVGGTPIYSKAWFEADPENRRLDEPRLEPGIGSAPYVLDNYDINRRIVYKRNPDYWGDAINVNVGRNNFETIRIEYFADSVAAMEAFKAGEYTFRQENSSKSWATSYDFPALAAGNVVQQELIDGNVPNAVGFVMNLTRPQFQDIRVREAVQLAFNFEWTNESLQYGLFQQRHSFWQGTPLEAKGVPEGRELEILQSLGDLIDLEILSAEPVMAHSSRAARQNDRRNLRKAMKLLDDAGWLVGDDGVRRNADGKVLEIEFLTSQPTLDRIILPFVSNLKTMGIEAKFNRIDPSQFTLRRRDRDFDMILGGYAMSLEPSTELFQWFGQESVDYSVFNPAALSGPAIEVLINNIVNATEGPEMRANAWALDRVLRNKRFMVSTWYLGKYWVAFWNKYEHPENLPPYSLGEEDLWWINADKAAALKASGALR
ncbi:MAG: ABC transporter substrate-binding protein [Rhodobacteraceae bacterium]|nr:ABC transporter substrate-binding protein [Paracoccaceae bacterium]